MAYQYTIPPISIKGLPISIFINQKKGPTGGAYPVMYAKQPVTFSYTKETTNKVGDKVYTSTDQIDIQFNALIEQTTTYESEVPQFPTEKGYSISDAIINKPLVLDLVVYLTNTPISWMSQFGNQSERIDSVLSALEKLYVEKIPFTVITTSKVYDNMAITSIKIPRKVDTGYALEIPVSLQQIIITQVQTVVAPSYLRSGKSGENNGTAKTKNTNKSDQETALRGLSQQVLGKNGYNNLFNLKAG